VAWNALQWYTLGAPRSFVGPLFWEAVRIAVLVVGLTLLTLLLIETGRPRVRGRDPRWLLVAGVPLAAITAPSLVVDLARYAPQEILMVGCMGLGAVILIGAFDRALEGAPWSATLVSAAAAGLVLWWFGVLQKETSVCVLLLAPFLWPTLAAERTRWRALDRGRRGAISLLAGGILLPYVPLGIRTLDLWLSGERVYEEASAAKGFTARFWDQLTGAGGALVSDLPTLIVVGAIVLLVASAARRGVDWLSVGLLVVALAFLVATSETGVVVSRYYLPPIVLGAFVLARSAVALGRPAVVVTGVILILGGAWQVRDARPTVERWADVERSRETLVREAAARAAGGCDVGVIGLNSEAVMALPVLMPLADEPASGCAAGERFLVVIDPGGPGTETPLSDPVLAACAPEPAPVWTSDVGKILLCTRRA
jgi:hypothetical protein